MEIGIPRLLLASTSRYRRDLLQRLRLPFDTVSSDVDEAPRPGEAPAALAARLAREKAGAVAARYPGAWVIGSDQVASVGAAPLGKPGDRARAIAQLTAMSGAAVDFHTAVAVARVDRGTFAHDDVTTVRFRTLSTGEIARYVDAEAPFDCAGSFKAEGLGIALFEGIDSCDPTALVGLPLIATAALLRRAGFALP